MPATSKYPVSFTTLFSTIQNAKLTSLCQQRGIPKTAILRQLVDAAYEHNFEKRPHCASGDTCRCPHTFVYGPND